MGEIMLNIAGTFLFLFVLIGCVCGSMILIKITYNTFKNN